MLNLRSAIFTLFRLFGSFFSALMMLRSAQATPPHTNNEISKSQETQENAPTSTNSSDAIECKTEITDEYWEILEECAHEETTPSGIDGFDAPYVVVDIDEVGTPPNEDTP